ncbi:hypothetical protein EV361DRAFT_985178, partial [Lentinula raphanica]
SRAQTDGMRAEQTVIQDEAVEAKLQAVGRQTHTNGARAEAVQRSLFPTPHNQYAPLQTNDAPEFAAPRSGSRSTPLPSKNVPKSSMAANLMAFQTIGTSAPFPFAPVLGTNSNVARHNAAAGDSGSSIYDSMHAPKMTAPQPVHPVNSTKPAFRFGGPFMPLAEVPEASNSDSASKYSEILNAAGGASTGTGDVGRLTPMRSNKGKDKTIANDAQTYDTDAEDL